MGNSPGKRLALFRKSLGLNQRAFAAALGSSQGRVGAIETDSAPPSRALMQKLADRFRVSSDWLLHGTGDMLINEMVGLTGASERIEPTDPSKPMAGDFAYSGEDFAMIRRMDLSISAGPGLAPVEGGQAEALAFSRAWLTRNQVSADLSVLVKVAGDSMAPAIPNNALVLVHCAENSVDRAGVFAFNRGDSSFVKRIKPISQSPLVWVISSDNPAYEPETVAGADLNEIRVIGRVRCALTTIE